MSDPSRVLPEDGPAAPPRANGELVFEAPWQSRIFGLTMALHEQDRFEWSEFQGRLTRAIARHEAELLHAEDYDYWACWMEAFRGLAAERGWLAPAALAALEAELAGRPPGHDH